MYHRMIFVSASFSTGLLKAGGLGFTFQSYNADDFMASIKRALDLYNYNREGFRALQKKEMETDFSWDVPAGRYMELFKNMLSW